MPGEPFLSVNGACGGRHGGKPRGWLLVQGPVRPMPVVMIYVLVQDVAQVPFVDDQQPIQALPPGRAHPPFRERVRTRRPRWGEQDPQALAGEDRVERAGELGVPVADEELQRADSLAQVHHQVARLLGHPLPGRMCRDTQQVHPAGIDLDDEQYST